MYPDYCHWTCWKRIYDRPIHCWMPKQKVKVILRDADCITSYVLNSGVTEPNLTKFLHGVEKWLPIALLESKLWSSNPFGNANVTNEDRRQIAGGSRQKLRVLTAYTPRLLNRNSPNLDMIYPDYYRWTRWKRINDRPIHCRMPKQRVMVTPPDVCEHLPHLAG